MIFARFEKHARPLQTLVNANVERVVSLTFDMAKVRELLESGHSISKSDCSVKASKLTREVRRLTGLVESKALALHTIPRLLEKSSPLWEELP